MHKNKVLKSFQRNRKKFVSSLLNTFKNNRKSKRDISNNQSMESSYNTNVFSKDEQNEMKYTFDCGKGNPLSLILDRKDIGDSYTTKEKTIRWLLIVIIFYWFPLIFVALSQPSLWQKSSSLDMPFLLDVALPFSQLVLTPMLIITLFRERRLVNETINQLFLGPVEGADEKMQEDINIFYKKTNKISFIISTLASVVITILWSMEALSDKNISWWDYGSTISHQHFNFIGWYCAILLVGFYWILLSSTALRCFFHYRVFRMIARKKELNINVIPLHPDKCGGLSMVSNIVKLNQPIVLAVGLVLAGNYINNIVIRKIDVFSLSNISMITGFIVLSILAFILPLLPYRKAMFTAKDKLLEKISSYFEIHWKDEMKKLKNKQINQIDVQRIENLKILYDLANSMPIWPYNWANLKRFLSYSLIPILTMVVSTIIDLFFGKAIDQMIL